MLRSIEAGADFPLAPDDAELLIDAGLVVRSR
jgi:hypothetical protein